MDPFLSDEIIDHLADMRRLRKIFCELSGLDDGTGRDSYREDLLIELALREYNDSFRRFIKTNWPNANV